MKLNTLLIGFFLTTTVVGQNNSTEPTLDTKGMFSLGARVTNGFFNSHGANSKGVGGQFRIQLSDKVNTEWYSDYITSNFENKIGRIDYHIGWSVFYYYLQQSNKPVALFQPFIEAGHCFDYTQVTLLQSETSLNRWSSAVQMGTGTHINLTNRFDVSLKVQYMLHLGGDIHAHENANGILVIEEHEGFSREGHLLSTLSVNYKIGKLWKSRK